MPIYNPGSGSGSLSANSPVSFTSTVGFDGTIVPTQITADQNDYAPSGHAGANVIRISSDATRTITGLAGGSSGRFLIIRNIGTNSIRFSHESASSTAANRFNFTDSVNPAYKTLPPGRSLWLQYEGSTSRWVDVSPLGRTSATDIRIGTDDDRYVTAASLVLSANAQVLVDDANVAWPMANGYNAELTIAANRTIDAPTGYKKGLTYVLAVIQSNGGSKTLAWANCYNFGQAGAPILSTANGKVDIITAYCYDATSPFFRMGFNRDI
jgi:hypothetical protein